MIEYLPQAVASLSAAANIIKGLGEIRDFTKINESFIQLQGIIVDTQAKLMLSHSQQSTMTVEIDELKKECMRLKDWASEREKYTRKEIANGIFAYLENGFVGKLQNAHKYCCNCFDNHKRSTLQQFFPGGNNLGLSCHNKCPDLVFWDYIDVTNQ